jgi:uncharacterized DUF497 family protein
LPESVHELLITDAALSKIGAREISADEAEELLRNRHVILGNPRAPDASKRRLLIGRTNGGRVLTLVIEASVEPTTWLLVTGWSATARERNLLPDA